MASYKLNIHLHKFDLIYFLKFNFKILYLYEYIPVEHPLPHLFITWPGPRALQAKALAIKQFTIRRKHIKNFIFIF